MLLIKLFIVIYLVILIPLYWKTYGLDNFLWLSDIGLFLTTLGIIFESPLLISMAAIGVFVFEIVWIIDYCLHLCLRRSVVGISDYMFKTEYSKFVRSLSLFHIFMPIIWIILLYQWGYAANAFYIQIILTWIILLISYFLSDPSKNINWVFVPATYHWQWMPSLIWLFILLIGIPLLFQFPLHILFQYIFKEYN